MKMCNGLGWWSVFLSLSVPDAFAVDRAPWEHNCKRWLGDLLKKNPALRTSPQGLKSRASLRSPPPMMRSPIGPSGVFLPKREFETSVVRKGVLALSSTDLDVLVNLRKNETQVDPQTTLVFGQGISTWEVMARSLSATASELDCSGSIEQKASRFVPLLIKGLVLPAERGEPSLMQLYIKEGQAFFVLSRGKETRLEVHEKVGDRIVAVTYRWKKPKLEESESGAILSAYAQDDLAQFGSSSVPRNIQRALSGLWSIRTGALE